MKVNEIITEKRIDESLPFLAGLGAIPMIFSAVMAGMKALSIYEIYDILSKNGYDIDKMNDDDKLNLFFLFIGMFIPGGKAFTNNLLMKIMPDWVKRRGIKMVGDHLKTKAVEIRKMKNANRSKYASTPSTPPKQAAKNQKQLDKENRKLTSQYQSLGKQLAAEKLKGQAFTVVGSLALLPLVYTYYGKLDELDKQYTAHKSGDKTTTFFADIDETSAYNTYQQIRNKYIGELTLGVTSALSRTPVGKLVDAFGNLVGKVGSAVGGKMLGGILKLPVTLYSRLSKVGGPALTVLMQTDEGQKFLSNSVVELITRGIGSISSGTVNFLAAGIDKVLGAAGVDSNVQGAVGSQPPPATIDTSELEKKYNTNRTPRDLYVTFDSNNPKIVYLGGIKMTDQQGFLLPGMEQYVKNIEQLSKNMNYPNPIQTLNLKFR